jgi:hypothetical protein
MERNMDRAALYSRATYRGSDQRCAQGDRTGREGKLYAINCGELLNQLTKPTPRRGDGKTGLAKTARVFR